MNKPPTDTELLDWLSSNFIKDFELVLKRAPAGNLSVHVLIVLCRAPMPVRDVIRLAMEADKTAVEKVR